MLFGAVSLGLAHAQTNLSLERPAQAPQLTGQSLAGELIVNVGNDSRDR